MSYVPGIATLDEFKDSLDRTLTSDDGELQSVLDGVSQRIENYCGREFRPDPPLDDDGGDTIAAVTRTVYPFQRARGPRWPDEAGAVTTVVSRVMQIPDAREVDTVTFNGTLVSSSDYVLIGHPRIDRPPWARLEVQGLQYDPCATVLGPSLVLTGRFGFWPAPDDLKRAVLTIAARQVHERDAGYADSTILQDGMTVNYFRQFQPWVKATVDFYRRVVPAGGGGILS